LVGGLFVIFHFLGFCFAFVSLLEKKKDTPFVKSDNSSDPCSLLLLFGKKLQGTRYKKKKNNISKKKIRKLKCFVGCLVMLFRCSVYLFCPSSSRSNTH